MKYEKLRKYEKPDLEEIELILEGSFLKTDSNNSNNVGGEIDKDPVEGDNWD